MPLTGNLSDFPIGDIIQLLNSTKKTGTLKVEAGGNFSGEAGEIRFKTGKIVYSMTNKGLTGREAILHFFEYKEGDFAFEETNPSKESNVEESTESLIMEGSRLITEWNKILTVVKTLSLVVSLSSTPPEGVSEIKLSKAEWKVLRMIDGKKTLREIAEELKVSDFEVGKIIYGFIVSGLVEKVSEGVEKITQAGVELIAKMKPEFYLREDVVFVDTGLIKEWGAKYKIKRIERISMHLPDGNDLMIDVKPRNRLKSFILIPEEIMRELSLKEKDKIFVEPVK